MGAVVAFEFARVAETHGAAVQKLWVSAGPPPCVVADMPEPLLSLYERLREQKNGVGVSALRARRCGGCSLQLDNQVLAQMAAKPSDEVLRCEECGRILVRTSESGL